MSISFTPPKGRLHRLASIFGAVCLSTACSADDLAAPDVPPTADFTSACENLACSFKDLSRDSDGSLVSLSWSFGDGGSAVTKNPTHTYASTGTYTVQLTVTDNGGASAHRSRDVGVANLQGRGSESTIAVSPAGFFFCTPAIGGSTRVCSGNLSGELSIANSGTGTLSWTASSDHAWLRVSPASGLTPSRHVAVSVNPAVLPPFRSAFNASITISAAGATNSPRTISVTVYQSRGR
ncbi:MAG TPA: PKD domain-containing protein [Gemmatimonadales bacterium]|nr:PKD domain-containing protein [Gemmatimonadales bacterium]